MCSMPDALLTFPFRLPSVIINGELHSPKEILPLLPRNWTRFSKYSAAKSRMLSVLLRRISLASPSRASSSPGGSDSRMNRGRPASILSLQLQKGVKKEKRSHLRTELVFVNLLRAQELIPNLPGRYDNPICHTPARQAT
jgi:hypothetical protein